MRILMVGQGGIALSRPLRWALEAGHKVWLLSPQDPYLLEKAPKYYRYLPFVFDRVNRVHELEELPTDEITRELLLRTAASQLRRIVTLFQPDIIHVHGRFFGTECCAMADVHPFVVSAWGAFNRFMETEVQSHTIDKLSRTILKAADMLIVETPNLVDKCKAWMNQFQKVELIPLGTNTQSFCPQPAKYVAQWRRALSIPPQAKVLFSPRGWGELYGHHQILEAYAMAYPRFQQPTVLVFLKLVRSYSFEEIREYYLVFWNLANELGMRQNIRWLPYLTLEMMPTAYSLADVVINYPKSDAFPSTLVEAIACSTAVITANLPAYRNTFIEEFCTLVEPQQPTALAQAMVEVVNRPSLEQEHHLAKGRQFIIENYDEEIFKKKLLTIYSELAASSHNKKPEKEMIKK